MLSTVSAALFVIMLYGLLLYSWFTQGVLIINGLVMVLVIF
jgi:hypothetical protein